MSGQYCVDANIFITAWHKTYPIVSFPTLWGEIASHRADLVLIKPIYDEIDPMLPVNRGQPLEKRKENFPLRTWLEENDFIDGVSIDSSVEQNSINLEKKYAIKDQLSKGANQNDIRLISYAKINDKTVVTFESMQKPPPAEKYNYKIPLICSIEEVPCIGFIGLLKALNIRV